MTATDDLIERLQLSTQMLCREAAALLREQAAEIARLRGERDAFKTKLSAEEIEHDETMKELYEYRNNSRRLVEAADSWKEEAQRLRADIERHVAICAEQATEIEGLQSNCTTLIQMIELMSEIPKMSDEQLRKLVANAKVAIDVARAGSKSTTATDYPKGWHESAADNGSKP